MTGYALWGTNVLKMLNWFVKYLIVFTTLKNRFNKRRTIIKTCLVLILLVLFCYYQNLQEKKIFPRSVVILKFYRNISLNFYLKLFLLLFLLLFSIRKIFINSMIQISFFLLVSPKSPLKLERVHKRMSIIKQKLIAISFWSNVWWYTWSIYV